MPKIAKTTKKKAKKPVKKLKSDDLSASHESSVMINVTLDEASDAEVVVKSNGTKKDALDAFFAGERILLEKSDGANDLYNQSRFGIWLEDGKLQLSLLEALFLLEKGRIRILTSPKRELNFEKFLKKAKKLEPTFWIRYLVFKDMRIRGYIVKTALKFGADFRVYDRGIKPGEDHARWVVYPVHEGSTLTWYDFAAKNRVAHSTKKRLLMGVVDDENDVTYYEIRWMRP
jgi:tRNA-intron endonuclease, archaea type